MKSGLFRILNVIILANLVACSSIAPSPTLTATLTPIPTSTQTQIPTATRTASPTATAMPTLPESLREVQERLGAEYRLIDQDGDGVYEIQAANGMVVEGLKVFEDGRTMLDIPGLDQTLVQPTEVINKTGDNKLVWGVNTFAKK